MAVNSHNCVNKKGNITSKVYAWDWHIITSALYFFARLRNKSYTHSEGEETDFTPWDNINSHMKNGFDKR